MAGAAFDGGYSERKIKLPAAAFDGLNSLVEVPYLQNGLTVFALGSPTEMANRLRIDRQDLPHTLNFLLSIARRQNPQGTKRGSLEPMVTLPLSNNDLGNVMSVVMSASGEIGETEYSVLPLHCSISSGYLRLCLLEKVGHLQSGAAYIPVSQELLPVATMLARYCK